MYLRFTHAYVILLFAGPPEPDSNDGLQRRDHPLPAAPDLHTAVSGLPRAAGHTGRTVLTLAL